MFWKFNYISSIYDFIIVLISEFKYNINLSNDYASGVYNLSDNSEKTFLELLIEYII